MQRSRFCDDPSSRRPGTMSEFSSNDDSVLDGASVTHDCRVRTADGGEFIAHRGFLCALSPVFQALFCVDYGGRRDVLLHDVTASTMDALFGYHYLDKLLIDEENVTEVLAAADMLLMDEVRSLCLNYMLRNMDIENCLGMATLARWYHCPNFSHAVLSYVREHFDQVWRTSDEFPEVSEGLLVELLASNELNVRNEADLLQAIVRWSSVRNASSASEAGADLSRLLQSVRVGLCGSLTVEDFCRLYPTLACSRSYCDVVCEAQRQGPCLCSPSPLLLVQYAARRSDACTARPSIDGNGDNGNTGVSDVVAAAAPRSPALPQRQCERCGVARNPERWLPRMPYEMLFVVGGWSDGQERDAIETYDPRAGRWLMKHMQGFGPRAYHGVALLANRLYVVGGMRDSEYLRSCECFDIESCTWETCTILNIARGYVSAVALEGYVYAVGGRNASERTASVERYSPRSNQWTLVSAMRRRRSDGAACAFKGKIYVSGGFNGQKVLTSVEEYTPSRNTWCLVRQLPAPRCSHEMAVLGGRIYVIGGYDGRRRLSSVLASGEGDGPLWWRCVTPMRTGRSTFAVALFDDELYVIGGFDGTSTTAEVERYSAATDSWRPMVSLNEAVSAMAACTVKGLNVSRRLSACAER
ncbi:kelch-like protein 10 [Dermacentor silvarum]|uniref:kelch-like protein 10 n=1 Tax=Dermacentor silvarum TaxID=543639 RepID=UPI002101B3C2|nr:kelch-like protein 10 [Dermacentor silvarum]